ncbi:MAG: EamA family transporter [Pikeienuella sp.]
MVDWVVSVEGQPAGQRAALILALISAAAHAGFGALQKGRFDPWLVRGAIDLNYGIIGLIVGLFVLPLPGPEILPILVGVFVVHSIYKLLLANAYQRGSYTAVYPVVRGVSPLATVVLAGFVFGERLDSGQWSGVILLTGAIMALAALNIRRMTMNRDQLIVALWLAFATGIFTAGYTTYDAWGIRLAENPFTFITWFFVVDGFLFPIISYRRWRVMPERPPLMPLLQRGFLGSLVAIVSFGSIMLATRLDNVGEAAALRETSVIFAAIFGWLFLKEEVGPARAGLMCLIALGAILVEFG